MKKQDDQLNKLKQTAMDIMKEDSNFVEVKVKKNEISIKRKPKDAGDENMAEITESQRKAAALIPDEYLLKGPKQPEETAPEKPSQ